MIRACGLLIWYNRGGTNVSSRTSLLRISASRPSWREDCPAPAARPPMAPRHRSCRRLAAGWAALSSRVGTAFSITNGFTSSATAPLDRYGRPLLLHFRYYSNASRVLHDPYDRFPLARRETISRGTVRNGRASTATNRSTVCVTRRSAPPNLRPPTALT